MAKPMRITLTECEGCGWKRHKLHTCTQCHLDLCKRCDEDAEHRDQCSEYVGEELSVEEITDLRDVLPKGLSDD